MMTVLINDSNFSWQTPINWADSVTLKPQQTFEVEGLPGSIYEPYSELRRYFTPEQYFDGEKTGRWYYNVKTKKRKGFEWAIDEQGYDFVLENQGDFECEVFLFNLTGQNRYLAPRGVKVVLRDIPIQHWLSRFSSVKVLPRKKVVAKFDANGVPENFRYIPEVYYEKRDREQLKEIEGAYLKWKKDNLIVGVE